MVGTQKYTWKERRKKRKGEAWRSEDIPQSPPYRTLGRPRPWPRPTSRASTAPLSQTPVWRSATPPCPWALKACRPQQADLLVNITIGPQGDVGWLTTGSATPCLSHPALFYQLEPQPCSLDLDSAAGPLNLLYRSGLPTVPQTTAFPRSEPFLVTCGHHRRHYQALQSSK